MTERQVFASRELPAKGSPEALAELVAVARMARLEADFAWAMQQVQVRRFLHHFMVETCRLFLDHPEGEAGERAEGRRSAALRLRQAICEVDPRLMGIMQSEYLADPELPAGGTSE